MTKPVIQKAITINASPEEVWRVFTDPHITRQLGGEYVTEWKIGSSFGWKALDGKMYTNGTILKLEPQKLLEHNLFNEGDKTVKSVITYKFENNNGSTNLLAWENINHDMTQQEFQETNTGWDIALTAVKEAAEKLYSS